jgi:hypothetical protein
VGEAAAPAGGLSAVGARAMELWQMDVVGRIFLADGTELSAVVTGGADHSRFCVCARLVARATARPVCDALVGHWEPMGHPQGHCGVP